MLIQTNNKKFNDWINEKIEHFESLYWTPTGVDLVLDNPDDNPIVRYEQLVDFFNTLKIPNLGEGNLQKIFDMGFETPQLVIELTVEDLTSILGSRIIAKKVFQGIRERLTNIPMYELMGAHPSFGRGVGVRKMLSLWEHFEGDMDKCRNTHNIVAIPGFDEKTAKKITSGYPLFVDFFKSIERFVTIKQYEKPTGVFVGQTIVITGFRDSNIESLITLNGGKVGSSVSSKTNLVVAKDISNVSGKLLKAQQMGVKIISLVDFQYILANLPK